MAKSVRVPIHRTSPTQTVQVEVGATVGAQIGVNLLSPDGQLVRWDQIANSAGSGGGSGSINTTDDLEEGQWNLWFTDRRAQDAVGGILADTATIDLTYTAGTSITATLKDLADSGTGAALVKITRDAKGRISGTSAATTTDLAEGTNLYYTDARVRATALTGLSTATATPVTATDSVLVGVGKLQGQATANATAIAGKEPAITEGTSAQFWRGDKSFTNAILGPLGSFPGNNTAGQAATCFEVGTDVAGRGAAIKSVRGAASTLTGMTLSIHNASGLVDVVTLNDDTTANIGSTLYVDPVNGRVGIGAAPTTYSFEVSSVLGGLYLNRQSTTLEPFVLLRSNSDATTGGQIRGAVSGYGIRFTTNATGQPTMLGVTTSQVAPGVDNAATSGTSALRWSVVYAATGAINTSDAREKTPVTPLTDAEIAAAAQMARSIGTYQWLASVSEKGDNARHHAGLTVQQAIAIMQAHGLDPFRYGFICYDQWDELPEVVNSWPAQDAVLDDAGNVITPAAEAGSEITQEYRPAGDRYSFRTDELLLFMARGFAARLDALETAR